MAAGQILYVQAAVFGGNSLGKSGCNSRCFFRIGSCRCPRDVPDAVARRIDENIEVETVDTQFPDRQLATQQVSAIHIELDDRGRSQFLRQTRIAQPRVFEREPGRRQQVDIDFPGNDQLIACRRGDTFLQSGSILSGTGNPEHGSGYDRHDGEPDAKQDFPRTIQHAN